MADTDQVKEAAEVYIYGYPLVYDLHEVGSFVEGGGSLPIQAPYNTFAYARRLLGPETKVVSPNNGSEARPRCPRGPSLVGAVPGRPGGGAVCMAAAGETTD